MTSHQIKTSPLVNARVAGFLYLIIFILGIFSELFVRQSLIVLGDTVATVNNIMASESLFRLAIVCDLIRLVVLILLPLVLYKLLSKVNKNYAVVMVAFVLVSVPVSMFNEINQLAVLLLLSDADYLTIFQTNQLHAHVMLFLDLYKQGGFITQFLGIWLLPLGYLVFKSGFLPKVIGVLLMIGCFGYLIDAFLFFIFSISNAGFSLFSFIGELLFALWLLVKGVNIDKWENRAVESV